MSASQNDSKGVPARLIAAELLERIIAKKRPMDLELAAHTGYAQLPASDRAFTYLLLKTAISRLGQADTLISEWMEKPLPDNLGLVQQALRLGISQLIWLEIAPHAAVHATVEAVKALGFPKHVGLVNALLNRCVREGKNAVALQDAAKLNTPEWLWESWVKTYGIARARAQAERHMREPALDISVKENAAEWADKLGGTLLKSGTVRVQNAGNVTQLPGFAEGAWWVQDAAAAIPALLLEQAAGGMLRHRRVLDMCAAPGGKTAQLITMGAKVTAVDQSAPRMETLKQNLSRLQLNAECKVVDAVRYKPDFTPEAILLDAPCSATGTIRRHPDVAYHRTKEDVTRLANAQSRLLHHAISLLPVGAPMVYAVCSLQPEEGEAQIRSIKEIRNDVTVEQSIRLPGTCDMLENIDDTDGFFMAVLRKIR